MKAEERHGPGSSEGEVIQSGWKWLPLFFREHVGHHDQSVREPDHAERHDVREVAYIHVSMAMRTRRSLHVQTSRIQISPSTKPTMARYMMGFRPQWSDRIPYGSASKIPASTVNKHDVQHRQRTYWAASQTYLYTPRSRPAHPAPAPIYTDSPHQPSHWPFHENEDHNCDR